MKKQIVVHPYNAITSVNKIIYKMRDVFTYIYIYATWINLKYILLSGRK